MRVLLTGSAGFIGTAIGTALASAGHEVVGVDLMLPQAHGDLDPPPGTHRLDVREAATSPSWADLLRGVDVVCHQAAMVGAGAKVSDLPDYAGHNDLGTATLLAGMHEAGVDRIVLASSMVVYGEGRYRCATHGEVPAPVRPVSALEAGDFDVHCVSCDAVLEWETVPEDARLDPRSSYAASKLAQEHFTSAWVRQAPGGAIALRYHNVYGPGMPRDTPYSGVAAIFRSSLEHDEPPRVFEDGAQMRDFVHVDDVARANVLALEQVSAGFRAYNVCSGRPVSILDVARRVAAGSVQSPAQSAAQSPAQSPAQSSGSALEPVVTGDFRPGDVRHVVASPERAAAELGFTAAVSPDDGLAAFATAPLRR